MLHGLASLFNSTPLDEAIAMCLAFFACGYLVSVRRITPLYVSWVWQLLVALTITRYLGSYWIYGRPLREGAWPIVWNVCAIFGAYVACNRKRR
jgi:hypothetical protein